MSYIDSKLLILNIPILNIPILFKKNSLLEWTLTTQNLACTKTLKLNLGTTCRKQTANHLPASPLLSLASARVDQGLDPPGHCLVPLPGAR